jgi:hypothetical protein
VNENKDDRRPKPLVTIEGAEEVEPKSLGGSFILTPLSYLTGRTPSAQPPEAIGEEPHPAEHITPQPSPNFSSAFEQKIEMENLILLPSLDNIQEQVDTLEPEVEIRSLPEEPEEEARDAAQHAACQIRLANERRARAEAEIREAEARQAAVRLKKENDDMARMLLQEQQERQRAADAQAAKERREREERESFARDCSTGSPTLAEHHKVLKNEVNRAGF